MSLFGFADINFNKDTPRTQGPLKALEGSPFSSNALRYPEDVGNFDKGHYMVFYVRQQQNTAALYKRSVASESLINSNSIGTVFQDVPLVGNVGTNLGGDLLNKLNSGLNSINGATGGVLSGVTSAISGAASGIQSSINNLFGQAASIVTGDSATTQKILSDNLASITDTSVFARRTQLTTDAIALYMPDTLMFTHSQGYDTPGIGGELAGQLMALKDTPAGRSVIEAIKSGKMPSDRLQFGKDFLNAVKTEAAQRGIEAVGAYSIDGLGSNQNSARVIGAAVLGAVRNPMLEMIYSSPDFRSFQFDFSFYPRSEKEAIEVQRIIERFRFHQAPEFHQETQGFLIPPSEFDIRFYYGGFQNPNIPKIGTCVMTGIDVNYAPNGFSAYEVPGESSPSLGRTGMPVAIQVTLQFKETSYLTKANFTSDNAF